MKKILFILFFLLFSSYANCQLLNPGEATETKLDILEKLIADKTMAPNIAGELYQHKKNKTFSNFKTFKKNLKRYQINFKNTKTILVFWKQNDKFSKLLLPKLEEIRKKYKESEIQFFLINTDDIGKQDTLVEFLNKYNNTECIFHPLTNQYYEKYSKKYYKPLTIPVLFADIKHKELYGVTAFPATIVIDEKGLVFTAMIGYWEEYEEWFNDIITRMNMPTEN